VDVIYWPEGIEDLLVTKRMADHDAPKAGVRRQTWVDGVATGGSAAREAG
jgi:hypothetical protein